MTDYLTEIDQALDADDLAQAATIAERALAGGANEPIVFNLAAWRLETNGDLAGAEALLGNALRQFTDDPTLYLAMGSVFRKQGRLKEAVERLDQAITLDPQYAAAWFERAATFEQGGALADAEADYRQAIRLEPGNGAAHAALAWVAARRGDTAGAREHGETALKLDPANRAATNALAQLAIEAGDHAGAVRLLEPVTAPEQEDEQNIASLTMLGDAYEGAARYDDAFGSYARAQTLFRTIHSAQLEPGRRGATDFLRDVGSAFAAADKTWWQTPDPASPSPPAEHVILTGYPRSGTTLAENILASLPGAVAVEEWPTLRDADKLVHADAEGLPRFMAASSAVRDELRRSYWQLAQDAARQPLGGKLFIDMDPFKGTRLPVIAKLFPAAKVVIMRRDPRDVIWSCFHTNFAFNAGTMEFASLESTARHYALSWSIIEGALETLPIDWFALRYEALVSDFDGTTQALCQFLGVEWSEDVRKFDRTAKQRGVSTASATQVRRGLYDGSGGWRRYASYFDDIADVVNPWVERFGYAV